MGVPILTPPLIGHTPAMADEVMALFDKIVTELDGQIDRDNLQDGEVIGSKLADGAVTNAKVADHAGIDFAKLGPLLDGQMVFGHTTAGVGVPEAHAMSGAGTVDNTGKLSLSISSQAQGADVPLAINGTTWTPIGLSASPPNGDYLVLAKCRIENGSAPGLDAVRLRLRDTAAVQRETFELNMTTAAVEEVTATIIATANLSGVGLLLDATTNAVSGSPLAKLGRLILVRYA